MTIERLMHEAGAVRDDTPQDIARVLAMAVDVISALEARLTALADDYRMLEERLNERA